MLDHAEVAKQLNLASNELFLRHDDVSGVEKLIKRLQQDGVFPELFNVSEVDGVVPEYSVLAVDGSQIHPDRHMPGNGCALINIGGILLSYGETSSAELLSNPELVTETGRPLTAELVDLMREERELQFAFNWSSMLEDSKSLVLIDGSLTFAHLASKSEQLRKNFLDRYLGVLEQFYEKRQPVASYMSLPRSIELVRKLQKVVCREKKSGNRRCHGACGADECKILAKTNDSVFLEAILPKPEGVKFYCTQVFNVELCGHFPNHLAPMFVCVNVGYEIARIEFPAWIAESSEFLKVVLGICCDQVRKGYGYPVSISEAHNQAVVTGPDRQFFYQCISDMAAERGCPAAMSEKLLKKRFLQI